MKHGCERDKTNLAILNFSVTIDLLEKRRKRSCEEFLEDELRYRLISERLNEIDIQITGFVIDRVV